MPRKTAAGLLALQSTLWLQALVGAGPDPGPALHSLLVLWAVPLALGVVVALGRGRTSLVLALLYGLGAALLFGFLGLVFGDPDDGLPGRAFWTPDRLRLVGQSLIALLAAVLCAGALLRGRKATSRASGGTPGHRARTGDPAGRG